jgi:hypothetical protein
MKDWTYAEAISKAEHLKAIGDEEIYLYNDPNPPWQHATSCEPGSTHRIDMATDVRFRATDPATGLRFRWSFAIEPTSASGAGSYQIDVDGCRRVLALLPEPVRGEFREFLRSAADAVQKQGDQYRAVMEQQNRDADALRSI